MYYVSRQKISLHTSVSQNSSSQPFLSNHDVDLAHQKSFESQTSEAENGKPPYFSTPLEHVLSDCLRVETMAELEWFMTWRCMPWLGASRAVLGLAEISQHECEVKAVKQFDTQCAGALTRADVEHIVRVFTQKWRLHKRPVRIEAGSHPAQTSFMSTFSNFFSDSNALVFHAHKDMRSPAVSFFVTDQVGVQSRDVEDRLALLVPLIQGTLVRVLKAERKVRDVSSLSDLSSKERALLKLIAIGSTDQEIAHKANRSVHTIKNQIRQMFERYGFLNRVHAVSAAFAASVIGPITCIRDNFSQK